MARSVAIIDYGAGNLFSVFRGLRAAGCENSVLATSPEGLRGKDAVLLPGVGAFSRGMERMRAAGLDEALKDFAASGNPILGVCLGMQMLFSRSYEFGEHAGLSLIPGEVFPVPEIDGYTVPNTGWNSVDFHRDLSGTPLAEARNGLDFYFSHSLYCQPTDPADIYGTIEWGAQRLPAVVGRDNVLGCQFHPEISDSQGVAIYKLFQK